MNDRDLEKLFGYADEAEASPEAKQHTLQAALAEFRASKNAPERTEQARSGQDLPHRDGVDPDRGGSGHEVVGKSPQALPEAAAVAAVAAVAPQVEGQRQDEGQSQQRAVGGVHEERGYPASRVRR